MTTLKVRFDGRVLVPEGPVDLPQGRVLEVTVAEALPTEANGAHAASDELLDEPPLLHLAKALEGLPYDPDTPTDLAAQHDHYLHGMPKRP